MNGSAAVRRTKVCLCARCFVLFNLSSNSPTFPSRRRSREDAGASTAAGVRRILAADTDVIGRDNAVYWPWKCSLDLKIRPRGARGTSSKAFLNMT